MERITEPRIPSPDERYNRQNEAAFRQELIRALADLNRALQDLDARITVLETP